MSKPERAGFTLAELLVVIVIIAVLVGLLLPAILSARGRARITQCMNNQAEISKAIAIYETSKDYFPGYVNTVKAKHISWIVAILEPLGQKAIWEAWRDSAAGDEPMTRIQQLVCPTDDEAQSEAPCSYVGNCGKPGVEDDGIWKYTGIFHDRSGGYGSPTMSTSDIKDGAQHTLMIAERRTGQADPVYDGHQWSDILEEQIGFTWTDDGIVAEQIWSNHPGIIVVSFCDGHQHQLKNIINYDIYRTLMTPDGAQVNPNEVLLQEGDY